MMPSFAISIDNLGTLLIFAVWICVAVINITKAIKKSKARAEEAAKARAIIDDFFAQDDAESEEADDADELFQDAFATTDSSAEDDFDEPLEEEAEEEQEETPATAPSPAPAYVPLAQQEAPSIAHAREHINSPADMGTVAPPPPVPPTPTSSGNRNAVPQPLVTVVGARHLSHLPKIRLSRSHRALRNAMMYREVLSKPRAFDF